MTVELEQRPTGDWYYPIALTTKAGVNLAAFQSEIGADRFARLIYAVLNKRFDAAAREVDAILGRSGNAET